MPSQPATYSEKIVQEKINSIATKLLQTHTLEENFKVICEESMKLVGAKFASIFMPDKDRLIRVYATHPILYHVTPRKKGDIYKVYTTNSSYIFTSTRIASTHPAFEEFKVGNVICIPLTFQKTTMGVLSVLSSEKQLFEKKDLDLIRYVGPLASLAIRNAQIYEQLNQAIEDRNLFISAAAHELKNPLTAAISYTDLLKLLVSKNKPIKKQYVDNLSKTLNQLKRLTGQFLEVENIKKGLFTYVMKRVNINSTVEFSIQNFKQRQTERQIIIDNRLLDTVYVKGDKTKLLQVFSNILNNAHKYSPILKPITIVLDRLSTHVIIQIIDEGIGIANKNITHIFNKYYAGDHKKAGIGLGLFLVKNIVTKHGGNISIESTINKGTTITITLPVFD